jgi:methylmalonyl-CoA carboxyltransferase 12S subunit
MQVETVDSIQLTEALAALRQEVARLAERVTALEAAAAPSQESEVRGHESRVRKPHPAACGLAADQGLSEELILVIGAAVAAYLGKRPHVRQIRLVGTTTWAQQGRVTIQASHALTVHHARSAP